LYELSFKFDVNKLYLDSFHHLNFNLNYFIMTLTKFIFINLHYSLFLIVKNFDCHLRFLLAHFKMKIKLILKHFINHFNLLNSDIILIVRYLITQLSYYEVMVEHFSFIIKYFFVISTKVNCYFEWPYYCYCWEANDGC
jgi:hypothetical protein